MIDRRAFLRTGTAAAGLVAGARISAALGAGGAPVPGATVQTSSGKVRGALEDKVQCFKGLQYGASTAGTGRFMPPAKPQSWTGVRDAFELGPRSPQLVASFKGQVIPEFEGMDRMEPISEDCLRLNVWTASTDSQAKRPVMVWLHGGGYTSGSGGFICYDGTQLAKKHDVVVVTVNHRLTALGYLCLEGFGPEFAHASNVGQLDIVAALEWVRDNIAAFGGDPGNVTIFGQSGGGGKVSTLMAMPSAKGLFHRAIVQSGAAIKGVSRDAARKSTEAYLAQLNLKPDQASQLRTLPLDKLLAATGPAAGAPGAGGAMVFAPVVDGSTLPTDPFDPTAPELSANVPLLIGTVETEVTFFPNQVLDPIDDAALKTHLKQTLRGANDSQVDKVIAAYKAGRPGASNTDLLLIISSDATFRAGVALEAERKAMQAKAAVYQYYFTWRTPVREGKLRTPHAIEIPFVFDNVDSAKAFVGAGADRYELATRISSAWTAFARTGNPSCKQLPTWKPFDTAQRSTMVFNDECKLVGNPNGTEQNVLHSALARPA
jgi:para-nitrobenzyl esterase